MEKLQMHTANKADENFAKLVALFPNAVTECVSGYDENGNPIIERAIDKEILMQEICVKVIDGKDERYQFTWPDKRKAISLAHSPIFKTLRPCASRSVDFNNARNIYIEGDNLDVLKLLQETYLEKIKLIYIDPPYNTGKDFVYQDDFSMELDEYIRISGQLDSDGNRLIQNTETNGRFHTDWLNMIYPRLKLAKNLLRNDGVILINMDENEFTNLQKVCQEIFGEQNEIGVIVWDKRNPKGDAQGISYQHEYVLAYTKNKYEFFASNELKRPKKNASTILKKAKSLYSKISDTYTLSDVNKEFSAWIRTQNEFSGGEKAYNKIDENGDVYRPVSMAWPNKKKAPDDYFIPLIHPVTQKPCPVPERGWRNPSSTMKQLLQDGLILFGKDETTIPNSKYLLKDNMYENIPSLLYYGGSDTAYLDEIGVPFDTPKVAEICKEHIISLTSKDDIILDFFSGSATTAHGVMLANQEDGEDRRYIMVQVSEKCQEGTGLFAKGFSTICEAGIERIKRTIDKLNYPDKGLRVLQLDTTNMKDVYYNPADFQPSLLDDFETNIKEDRTPEDLLFQIMLDLGVMLSAKIEESVIAGKKVFNVEDNYLIACFDADVTEETITAIAKQKPYYFVMRDSSMANDSVATNFEQIFATYSPDTVRKVL